MDKHSLIRNTDCFLKINMRIASPWKRFNLVLCVFVHKYNSRSFWGKKNIKVMQSSIGYAVIQSIIPSLLLIFCMYAGCRLSSIMVIDAWLLAHLLAINSNGFHYFLNWQSDFKFGHRWYSRKQTEQIALLHWDGWGQCVKRGLIWMAQNYRHVHNTADKMHAYLPVVSNNEFYSNTMFNYT